MEPWWGALAETIVRSGPVNGDLTVGQNDCPKGFARPILRRRLPLLLFGRWYNGPDTLGQICKFVSLITERSLVVVVVMIFTSGKGLLYSACNSSTMGPTITFKLPPLGGVVPS